MVLTGSELRHRYFRKALAWCPDIDVVASFCETAEGSLSQIVSQRAPEGSVVLEHLRERDQVEEDFFGALDLLLPDDSKPASIPRGALNDQKPVQERIFNAAPDVLVCYGTSIIKGELLTAFRGKFVNIHLGLSPYYRGSGTNFWPLVNGEPEYVGATFMHIDEGVDTGEIIHQARASIYPGDGPHQIGNRLIRDLVFECARLLRVFHTLEPMPRPREPDETKYYRKKDFTDESVIQLRKNFRDGMIGDYLSASAAGARTVPIVGNPALEDQVDG